MTDLRTATGKIPPAGEHADWLGVVPLVDLLETTNFSPHTAASCMGHPVNPGTKYHVDQASG
jgi:hypothetical protein